MTNFSSVRAVAFDVGDTLCYPVSGSWLLPPDFFTYVSRSRWEALPAERLRQAKTLAAIQLAQTAPIADEEQEYRCFLAYYRALFAELPEFGLTQTVLEELAQNRVYSDTRAVYYDDVRPCLEQLKQRFRLGLLSDTWPSLRRAMRAQKLDYYFENQILSCDFGICKPDRRLYEASVRAFGLKPQEILFIDNLLPNLDGAAQAGMLPVQIRRNRQQPGIYPAVQNLEELCSLLDS